MSLYVGIDEAGRGCVLGPLVIACVASAAADRRWFRRQNVRDSKIVPAEKRDALAPEIMARCWFRTAVFVPAEIDAAVRDRSRTLNGLELEGMSSLICSFANDHAEPARILIDAPSINAEGFKRKLQAHCGWRDPSSLFARHRADQTDRTVAAASLIAKYERERLIAELKTELGIDFGCGYPHDEATRRLLKSCPRDAHYVRWSWKTAQSGD